MKKLIWILVILVVIGVFGGRAWWLYQHQETGNNVVKVGLLSFNSGMYADLGIALDNGAKLAVEEVNANSDNIKLHLSIEDGKGFAKDAINAFNKLDTNSVDVMIIAGENQVPPVAPLIETRKIPTILTSVGTLSFQKNNKDKYMFLVNPSAQSTSAAMGKYAKNELKLNNYAILSVASVYGQESAAGFTQGFNAQPLIWEKYKETDLNARSQIAKILATDPEGVYVVGYGPGYTNALNQLKEQGYTGVIMSDYTISGQEAQENVKDKTDIFFAEADSRNNPARLNGFLKAFHAKYGKEATTHAKMGYDAIYVIAEALKNSSNVKEGLEKINGLDTFFGKLTFNTDGSSNFPVIIKQMQADGTAKIVKE